jgi:hypothetical protein
VLSLAAAADEARGERDDQTLLDVVNSYNTRFSLNLTDQEKSDLVEYLKSL